MSELGPLDAAGELPPHEGSDDITHILWRDRDVEVVDFARAERRMTSLVERLSRCSEAIEIRTQTAHIQGHVLALCADFIVVGDTHQNQVQAMVANAAVLGVQGLPTRTTSALDAPIRERTRISAWLACIEGRNIRLTMSRVALHGQMLHVWADHFDLQVNHSRITVPLVAVHSLQVVENS